MGWRFWSNRSQAKKYLKEQLGEATLKAVLEKMPWNASRSLSVLCLLVKSGLPASSVAAIFGNDKATLEGGNFDIYNLPDISIDVIKNLAQCRTPTFLKKIANAVVAAKFNALRNIVIAAPDPVQKQAAAREIIALAGEGSPLRQITAQYPYEHSVLLDALGRVVISVPDPEKGQAQAILAGLPPAPHSA